MAPRLGHACGASRIDIAELAHMSRCVPGPNPALAGILPVAAGNAAELSSKLHPHEWRHADA
jgi:hypothetical protein